MANERTWTGRLAGLVLLFGLANGAQAQSSPDTWWVAFTDKAHSPYSLQAPQDFLSARAIARRQRYGIAVDSTDLPVDPAYIQQVRALGAVQVLLVSKWLNAITIRTDDPVVVDGLAALPFVRAVKNSRNGRQRPERTEKFPMPERGTMDEAEYGLAYHQIAMMNGHLLHGLGGARGEGMLIGVLDSGFELVDVLPVFEALRGRNGIKHVRDMVEPGGNPYAQHNHGRMVLSILAGELPGELKGSAPMADYVLVRTENVDGEYLIEEDNWVSGAEYCDSLGCDVLNTSLGYTTFDDPAQDHVYADMDGNTTRISIAAAMAARKGMLPVNSAGNQGENAWYHISAPADAVGVLAVGGVRADGSTVGFSSRGPSADGRVKPDVTAQGFGTMGSGWDPYTVSPINGTSFSAPLVSGLVACLWQLHPAMSNSTILEAVRNSASQAYAPDNEQGYGIPDFWKAHRILQELELIQSRPTEVLGVMPNPFHDHLELELITGSADRVTMQLFDATGRAVWNGSTAVDPVGYTRVRTEARALLGLPTGLYVLQVQLGDVRYTGRVVKALR